MKPEMKEFLETVFDPEDQVCISPDGFAYKSISQSEIGPSITLVSNNPKVKSKQSSEDDMVLVAMNAIDGPRNDESVTKFRTFLIELDEGSLKDQMEYIEKSGLPFSVCVFSGNKSLHFGIVLDEPYAHISLWRHVNQWILNILKEADQKTKNPSRCIRLPGNMRKDGKAKKQTLIKNNGRVKKDDLSIWLNKHMDQKPVEKKVQAVKDKSLDIINIPEWIRDHWKNGVDANRNVTWFNIACWCAEHSNWDEDKFIEKWEKAFEEESDFKRSEWTTTIKSAFKKVRDG